VGEVQGSGKSGKEEAVSEQVLTLRHLGKIEEFELCLDVERQVWASADIDLVPLPIFVVVAHTGGQVLGAFDGDQMAGFTLAMPGFREGKLFLHSHMTAVLESYRDKGVGRRLKLFQREDALNRGIDLVEWTFDPLELKNAYFNLERLGAIVREFLPNVYGITTSPLHAGLPTDRLVAQWWLRTPRVQGRVSGSSTQPTTMSGDVARIPVPRNIGDLKTTRPAEAAEIQSAVRGQFEDWLGRGYIVTGIEMSDATGTYLLQPADAVKDL
jgi:predicted GNAT superfamily acetyltransferase